MSINTLVTCMIVHVLVTCMCISPPFFLFACVLYIHIYNVFPCTCMYFSIDLLTVPPGFESGITFDLAAQESPTVELTPPPTTVNISELLLGGGEMVMEWGAEEGEKEEEREEREQGEVATNEHPSQLQNTTGGGTFM